MFQGGKLLEMGGDVPYNTQLSSHLCECEVHSDFYHQTCYIMHRLVLETSVGCYRIIQAERCFSIRCSPRWKPFMLTLTNQKCGSFSNVKTHVIYLDTIYVS